MQKRTINIGYKVICSESGVVGTVIRFYHPTSCEEQTLVETENGKRYHAPTRTWSVYTDGYRPTTIIIDEPIISDDLLGDYGRSTLAFSTNYGSAISEALSRKSIRARTEVM